mmetsp:Transcript_16526/g.29885  ORF Transcript_16526/g.29885 Transcript_16526/m.29885 type:complete len:295 (-) Transcript_16526:1226-2110(-)
MTVQHICPSSGSAVKQLASSEYNKSDVPKAFRTVLKIKTNFDTEFKIVSSIIPGGRNCSSSKTGTNNGILSNSFQKSDASSSKVQVEVGRLISDDTELRHQPCCFQSQKEIKSDICNQANWPVSLAPPVFDQSIPKFDHQQLKLAQSCDDISISSVNLSAEKTNEMSGNEFAPHKTVKMFCWNPDLRPRKAIIKSSNIMTLKRCSFDHGFVSGLHTKFQVKRVCFARNNHVRLIPNVVRLRVKKMSSTQLSNACDFSQPSPVSNNACITSAPVTTSKPVRSWKIKLPFKRCVSP